MRILLRTFIYPLAVLFFYSCKTSFPVSDYAKYNQTADSYLIYYSNDSLGLSLDFLGRQRIQKGFIPPKLSPELKKLLRKRVKGLDAKMFYASRSTGRYFGYKLYGFVFNNRANTFTNQLKTKRYSFYGSTYYSDSNSISISGQWRIRDILLPLKHNKNALFIWVKEMDPAFDDEWNKSEEKLFIDHTEEDLSTLSTGEEYKVRRKKKDSLLKEINGLVETQNYITPLHLFDKVNEDSIDTYGLTSFFYQMKANAYSFVDNMAGIRDASLKSFSKGKREVNEDVADSLKFHPAFKDSIINLAEKAQVLMFNESHYDWRNRWLVTLMLPQLKKIGYRYLCMEALGLPDSANVRGFPSLRDGFYYKEPFMANLMRTAIDLGFKIISYEDTIADHTSIDERERSQAANLFHQFEKDQLGKWLVYAGYAHINKNGFSKGQPSMFQYFQKLCKAEIKCINQTKYSIFFYGPVNTGFKNKGFFIVNDLKRNDSDADMFIISDSDHLPFEDSSTNEQKGLITYAINKNILSAEHSSDYLFVYVKSEYLALKQNAIPLFIKKIRELKNDYLILPENEYLFFTVDANDKLNEL